MHHLRFTLEDLPIGQIEISSDGTVQSVDDWTSSNIDFGAKVLNGSSVLQLFPRVSKNNLTELLRQGTPGYIGREMLQTSHGQTVLAELALVPSFRLHRMQFSIVYFHGLDTPARQSAHDKRPALDPSSENPG